MERLLIEVRGTVQGVGFRPHVYSLATTLGLSGFAQNRGGHVFIDLEGEPAAVRAFVDNLSARPPARAAIETLTCQPADPVFRTGFSIASSDGTVADEVRVSPDIATCDACARELFDPANRRYRYPFITCTDCGPRFTIVTGVPYDRRRTTMAGFAMCGDCRREYENPADRRFHAQPIACQHCGPSLTLEDEAGTVRGDAALDETIAALLTGRIAAIKGLGGYHLACDANNEDAVAALRVRKHRDAKPFAVMIDERLARGLQQFAGTWHVLTSPERPIVLVDRREMARAEVRVAEAIAPGCPAIGVMLPYTPLHHLLMHGVGRPLVMTSGNRSDEPMAFDDADARRRLQGIADLFLTHDRPIHVRCDDSIVRPVAGSGTPVRRARGFAPAPMILAEGAPRTILAAGAHLKNTFCLYDGERAWVSPHVGDLASASAYAALAEGVRQATQFLGIDPEVVAHDLHPDYLSTRFAQEFGAGRTMAVQHHHAHVLSCAAEHGITGPILGVAFDGSGFGADGAVWGGEFLLADGPAFTRLAHLAYVPLPGGEAAVREPWRMALAHLVAAGEEDSLQAIAERIGSRFHAVRQLIDRGSGAPTSSAGRLFDAVASLAGGRDTAAFEGQAAMELEAIADDDDGPRYGFATMRSRTPWIVDPAPVVADVAADLKRGRSPAGIAAAFHEAMAEMIATVAAALADASGTRHVALTGGVFQNARLTASAARLLERRGVAPLIHRRVPCNDGGLSLGQAVAAARTLSMTERDRCV